MGESTGDAALSMCCKLAVETNRRKWRKNP
jgi:hypothetical protein